MGIAGIGDAFSSKHVTAQIFTSDGGWYAVPITKQRITFGHFFAKIKNRYYVFQYDPTRVHGTRSMFSKSARTILYFASSATAITIEELDNFEKFIRVNKTKKITLPGAILLSYAKARSMFTEMVNPRKPQNKTKIIDVQDVADNYLSEVQSDQQKSALREQFDKAIEVLGDKVNTAIYDPSPFLDSRLNDNPEMLSGGYLMTADINHEWKAISNPAKGPFAHWLLVFVIIGAIGIAAAVALLTVEGSPFAGQTLDDFIEAAKSAQSPPPPDLVGEPTVTKTENATTTDFALPKFAEEGLGLFEGRSLRDGP